MLSGESDSTGSAHEHWTRPGYFPPPGETNMQLLVDGAEEPVGHRRRGTCAVCGATRRLLTEEGHPRRHRDGDAPCPGSDRPAVDVQ